MKCIYCNHEFDHVYVDCIDVLDGDCPSSCDDKIIVIVDCPRCGRPVWQKPVDADYLTWHTPLPNIFRVVQKTDVPGPSVYAEYSYTDDEFWIDIEGETFLVSLKHRDAE